MRSDDRHLAVAPPWGLVAAVLLATGLAPHVAAADESPRWRTMLTPDEALYPRSLADPRRPRLAFGAVRVDETEIPFAGASRLDVRIGAHLPVLRLHPEAEPERGFEIGVDVGFAGQFDRDHSTDNIGWDGTYGLELAWRPSSRVALRTGAFHVSAHLGDEYVERRFEETGTLVRRASYTREEVYLGLSLERPAHLRGYVEGAWAYELRNPRLQQPARAQLGLEWRGPPVLWDALAPFAAVDVSSFEENDWSPDVTLQAGLLFRDTSPPRLWRLALEYYDGRSRMAEFFLREERSLGLLVIVDP